MYAWIWIRIRYLDNGLMGSLISNWREKESYASGYFNINKGQGIQRGLKEVND